MKELVRIALCGGLLLCISGVKAQGYYDVTVRKQTDKIEALKNAKGSFQPLSYEEIYMNQQRDLQILQLAATINAFSDLVQKANEYAKKGDYETALDYYEDLLEEVYILPEGRRLEYKRALKDAIKFCKEKLKNKGK